MLFLYAARVILAFLFDNISQLVALPPFSILQVGEPDTHLAE
jgi:hypothetical protein